ncbi:LysR family transcriptional regulator ArgP [Demequina sp. SYSU T00192]|uniref:LysR family transcriptional regulator ArgP n=1 Tax=Demequina litoralis TaxID=3051660 RepID=A0ABT8G7X3_9MICO|nr:LysR family transcriptional regulator ArgP [Demequina sp. SYSU T00192]MDN4475029.1 LysR family transcriptional regulator ArgP [Demequina sp. SYSU T00192]
MKIPADLAQTLAAVVDEGSLDAGARALHVTQSAVSQRLATLERLTGQVLLVRSRPVRPTPAGEAVVRFARQVALLEAEAASTLGIAEDRPAPLRIAVNADSLATWLLPPLAAVLPGLGATVHLHREDEQYTADLLQRGEVVAAVTTRAAAVPGCSVTRLGRMRYRAVAAPSFAARWFGAGVSPETLAVAPVVDFDRRDTIQTRWLEARGADPDAPPRHRVPSSSEFARAIALGMGWGLLPAVQREGLELVDLGDPAEDMALHWQQWRVQSAALDTVAAAIREAARGALEPA